MALSIEIASVEYLAWEPLGTHGIERKLLRHDADTDAVCQYVRIPANWKGGGVAHYHSCFEEAFIISGDVSLVPHDTLVDGSYLYRPAHIVHGHDEHADQGCLCIIRMGGQMDFNLVPDPISPEEYALEDIDDPRGHIVHLRTPSMVWQSLGEGAGQFSLKTLSSVAETGAYTALISFPPGWCGHLETPAHFSREWIVLEGSWTLADGSTHGALSYQFHPSGRPDKAAATSETGCLVLTWCERNGQTPG